MPRGTNSYVAARVGANIRRLRDERAWTQSDLAKRLERATSQKVSDYERGVNLPSDDALHEIAAAFAVDVSELLEPITGSSRADAPAQGDPAKVAREIERAARRASTPRGRRGAGGGGDRG